MSDAINIRSSHDEEFMSKVVLDGQAYIVVTENTGRKNFLITTKVFLNGEAISTTKTDYGSTEQSPDVKKAAEELMARQHELSVKLLKSGKLGDHIKSPSEYLDEVRKLLRRKNNKNALVLLREGVESYPEEPFLLSYYGCLVAIVAKKHKEGVQICKNALKLLHEKMPEMEKTVLPTFYLNLSRAYLASGEKADAIAALNDGLAHDKSNTDIQWELRKLGTRRKPVLPFLGRANPLNKYMGILLHRIRN